jgi:hypothetical protein
LLRRDDFQPSFVARNDGFRLEFKTARAVPISVVALESLLPPIDNVPSNPAIAFSPLLKAAPAGPVLFDVTMSIPDDPAETTMATNKVSRARPSKTSGSASSSTTRYGVRDDGERRTNPACAHFRKGRFARGADIVWAEKGHRMWIWCGRTGRTGEHVQDIQDGSKKADGSAADYDMLAE